jgi:hypothetical protein
MCSYAILGHLSYTPILSHRHAPYAPVVNPIRRCFRNPPVYLLIYCRYLRGGVPKHLLGTSTSSPLAQIQFGMHNYFIYVRIIIILFTLAILLHPERKTHCSKHNARPSNEVDPYSNEALHRCCKRGRNNHLQDVGPGEQLPCST